MEEKNESTEEGDSCPPLLTEIKEPVTPRNDEITGSD